MNRKTLAGIVLALVLAAIQSARAEQGTQTVGVPVSYSLPTDGPLPRTYRVTLAITAPDNPDWIVSTFVAGTARTVTTENKGRFTETWDGLDENYMPVPPGNYGVKGIYMPARQVGDHRRIPFAHPKTGRRRGGLVVPHPRPGPQVPVALGGQRRPRHYGGYQCRPRRQRAQRHRRDLPLLHRVRLEPLPARPQQADRPRADSGGLRLGRCGGRLGHRHRRRVGLVPVRQRRHPLPLPRRWETLRHRPRPLPSRCLCPTWRAYQPRRLARPGHRQAVRVPGPGNRARPGRPPLAVPRRSGSTIGSTDGTGRPPRAATW